MELQYYETIRETGHLQVRFEPVLSPAGVFPAHWHEYVEILSTLKMVFFLLLYRPWNMNFIQAIS